MAIYIYAGGDVDLTCTIANGKEYPILWIRKDKSGDGFPISTGPNLLIPDKKFSLKNSEKEGTYTLTIRDVQPSDAATYQCQVVVSLTTRLTEDVLLQVRNQHYARKSKKTRTHT